jgi:hypothetical protein
VNTGTGLSGLTIIMHKNHASRYTVRKLVVLFLLGAFGSASFAGTRASMHEVEQMLRSLRDKPDGEVATTIANLELTERASSLRLAQWQAEFQGKQTREALLALADASAFLELPSEEIPQIAMPDDAERKQILSRTIEYVRTTLHRLPNFSAKRSTTHFEDVPEGQLLSTGIAGFYRNRPADSSSSYSRVLHVLSKASIVVKYLNGLEVVDAGVSKHGKVHSPAMRLTTSGEFGPVLSVVIGDAIGSQVFWGHWEQGADGPMAVLRYVVPEENSHYAVTLGNVRDKEKPQFPAYHGEIAVDPKSGTILRVTMESELNSPHRTFKSGILVEYGPVTIGNRAYICPIKSEALSKLTDAGAGEKARNAGENTANIRYLTCLNDVSFTDYHVFRAEVRIVP